jgi:hypothetical protein
MDPGVGEWAVAILVASRAWDSSTTGRSAVGSVGLLVGKEDAKPALGGYSCAGGPGQLEKRKEVWLA